MNGVLDASAFVSLLVGWVKDSDVELFDGDFAAPDLFLIETASGLRRSIRTGVVSPDHGGSLLLRALELPISLVSSRELVERAFEMRDSMTIQDGCYVALAEQLECGVLTADRRLARAPGITVPVTVV
jgi:predicted nucleic acid-binding protein